MVKAILMILIMPKSSPKYTLKSEENKLIFINKSGQDHIIQTVGASYEIIRHGLYKTKRIFFWEKQVNSALLIITRNLLINWPKEKEKWSNLRIHEKGSISNKNFHLKCKPNQIKCNRLKNRNKNHKTTTPENQNRPSEDQANSNSNESKKYTVSENKYFTSILHTTAIGVYDMRTRTHMNQIQQMNMEMR